MVVVGTGCCVVEVVVCGVIVEENVLCGVISEVVVVWGSEVVVVRGPDVVVADPEHESTPLRRIAVISGSTSPSKLIS